MRNINTILKKLSEFFKSVTAILAGLGAIFSVLFMIWRNVAQLVKATNDIKGLLPIVKTHDDYIKIELATLIDRNVDLANQNVYDEQSINRLISIRDTLPNLLTYTQKQKINSLEYKLNKYTGR